jgi:4-hydroxybenzoate polyprenyltransferase
MTIVNKRRPTDILRGFFWLCHPGPVLLNVTAVTIFALLATWPYVPWNILPLVIAAHLAMQLSIAIFNDYCDRERDVLSKKNKPIVRGLILPREALFATIILMLTMVLLLIPLNPQALLVSLLYLACGQSYNLGLKTTPLSGIVFALAIPLIPLYAFVGVGHFMPLVVWQMPIAALLGVALHLANALPDIEQDVANQVHNLVVVLGSKGSLIACSLLILLAAIVTGVLAITGLVPAQPWILLPTLLLVTSAASILFLVFRSKESHQAYQTYFYLVVLTCLVLAGGWLTSALV